MGIRPTILTNDTDLSAAEIGYRMTARWRQENHFAYAREYFALDALDALDSYADHQDDPTRQVPNLDKARALTEVATARADIAAAHALVSHAIKAATIRAPHSGSGGKATVDPAAQQALTAAESALAAAQAASRVTISHSRWRRSGPQADGSKPNASCSPPRSR